MLLKGIAVLAVLLAAGCAAGNTAPDTTRSACATTSPAPTATGQPIVIRKSGVVIDGLTVVGRFTEPAVVVEGSDVVIRRATVINQGDGGGVLFRGARGTIDDSFIAGGVGSSGVGVTIRDNCINGPNDGIHITSDTGEVRGVVIEGNTVSKPVLHEGSHYDGIQLRGAVDVTIRNNTIDARPWSPQISAAINLQGVYQGNRDVHVTNNTILGGGYSLYVSDTDVEISDNRIGDAHYGLLEASSQLRSISQRGNVDANTGQAITLK